MSSGFQRIQRFAFFRLRFEIRKPHEFMAVPPKVKFRKRKNVDGLDEDADVPLTLADLMNGDAFVSTAVQSPGPSHVSTTTLASPSQPKSAAGNSDPDEPMEVDQKPDPHPMVVGQGAKPGRIIGNDHPLYDFKSNIARGDVVTKAVADLGQVIPEIVAESFSSQRFDEALECMKVMRDVALQVCRRIATDCETGPLNPHAPRRRMKLMSGIGVCLHS
jgi:ATP-dependent DNA helicase 2 subunit 2